MEMTNTRLVPAPVATVWEALNDTETLKACIPGCESLEKVSDDEWRAALTARVGPVSAKFNGTMRLIDATPPTGYTLQFEGKGGPAGFAKGEAKVTLAPADGNQTSLTYVVKANVGGKLAQIGSRLIDGAATKLADDFFTCFTAKVAAPPDAAIAAPEDATVVSRNAPRSFPVWRAIAAAIIAVMATYWLWQSGRLG
ncbi:MAG: carbon monoxide dehydrogenase subunit G [Betaproteobacteria bacterium]|nr:carbon monoxide dehydrogenase subunit G [Betaproteobacteria bacterium]